MYLLPGRFILPLPSPVPFLPHFLPKDNCQMAPLSMIWVPGCPGPGGHPQAGWLGNQDLPGRRKASCRDLHFPGRSRDVGIRTNHAGGLDLGDVAERLLTDFTHGRIAQCLLIPIALKAKGSTTQPGEENVETHREESPRSHPPLPGDFCMACENIHVFDFTITTLCPRTYTFSRSRPHAFQNKKWYHVHCTCSENKCLSC